MTQVGKVLYPSLNLSTNFRILPFQKSQDFQNPKVCFNQSPAFSLAIKPRTTPQRRADLGKVDHRGGYRFKEHI
jgi:hypothetical protein